MRKKIFILLLLLPAIFTNAQDTTDYTKSLMMQEAIDRARDTAVQQEVEEKMDAEAEKEAKEERFHRRLFANWGSIVLILIAVYVLRKKKGTPVR